MKNPHRYCYSTLTKRFYRNSLDSENASTFLTVMESNPIPRTPLRIEKPCSVLSEKSFRFRHPTASGELGKRGATRPRNALWIGLRKRSATFAVPKIVERTTKRGMITNFISVVYGARVSPRNGLLSQNTVVTIVYRRTLGSQRRPCRRNSCLRCLNSVPTTFFRRKLVSTKSPLVSCPRPTMAQGRAPRRLTDPRTKEKPWLSKFPEDERAND